MICRLRHCALIFIVLLVSSLSYGEEADFSWDKSHWNQSLNTAEKEQYLSDLEKDIVMYLNRVRFDPALYAVDYIAPRSNFFHDKYYKEPGTPDNFLGIKTQEGAATVEEAVDALNKTKSMATLKPNKLLFKAAKHLAEDQSKSGDTGHVGGDKSTPKTRVEHEGQWEITMGENIAYGPDNGRDVVTQLLMDDGVPSRGHRKNILNPKYKVVGVACRSHPKYRVVCVMDLAGGMK